MRRVKTIYWLLGRNVDLMSMGCDMFPIMLRTCYVFFLSRYSVGGHKVTYMFISLSQILI